MTGYVEVRELMPNELLDTIIDVRQDVHGLGMNLHTLASYAEDGACIDGDEIGVLSDLALMASDALSQLEPMVAALVKGGDRA